jgi:hypothetical protein
VPDRESKVDEATITPFRHQASSAKRKIGAPGKRQGALITQAQVKF